MEISLGDVFKSPYFNRMIAALAVATVVAAFMYPESKTLIVLAIAFSVYTLFTIILWFKTRHDYNMFVKDIEKESKKYEAEKTKKAKAQAEYIFGRISHDNQQLLMSVIREGVIKGYRNSRIFRDKRTFFPMISKLQNLVCLDSLLWDKIKIDETNDSVSVIIEPNLYDVIIEKMNTINAQ